MVLTWLFCDQELYLATDEKDKSIEMTILRECASMEALASEMSLRLKKCCQVDRKLFEMLLICKLHHSA